LDFLQGSFSKNRFAAPQPGLSFLPNINFPGLNAENEKFPEFREKYGMVVIPGELWGWFRLRMSIF